MEDFSRVYATLTGVLKGLTIHEISFTTLDTHLSRGARCWRADAMSSYGQPVMKLGYAAGFRLTMMTEILFGEQWLMMTFGFSFSAFDTPTLRGERAARVYSLAVRFMHGRVSFLSVLDTQTSIGNSIAGLVSYYK